MGGWSASIRSVAVHRVLPRFSHCAVSLAGSVVEGAKMQPVLPLTDFSFDFQDVALKRVGANAGVY